MPPPHRLQDFTIQDIQPIGSTSPINHGQHSHSALAWAFSKVGLKEDSWLQRHRGKIVLGATSALAAFEYGTTGAVSMSSQLAMVFGAAVLAHESSEELMESVDRLKESHNINSGVIGVAAGAAHTASEFLLSAFATTGNYSDMVVATTMGSNVSHIPLMVGVAATIGAVSIDRFSAYKMNSAAIAAVTGAFGYQIATGEFNPYLSAGMVGAAFGYLHWRVRAGQTCETHDHCHNHSHNHAHDDKDYISLSYWRDAAKGLKLPKPNQALKGLNKSVQSVKETLSSLSLTSLKQIGTRIKSAGQSAIHPNIVALTTSLTALGFSAHILGNNVVKIAEQQGATATAMGATVAALAFALPELILTGKAALKKDGEMAWGAITGCTIATVGIVGGYQGLSGFEIPTSLGLAFKEGKLQMAAFAGSAAAIVSFANPWTARQLAKVDNIFAKIFEKRYQNVSDWLRNDGTKIPKIAAAPMLVAALSFYAYGTLPICHSHGNWVHCLERVPENAPPAPLPSPGDINDALKNAQPETSGPSFKF